MTAQRAVIFDLETVPDLVVGRELLQVTADVPDREVRRLLGEKYARPGEDPDAAFVKVPLQKIVSIGALYAERTDQGPWAISRSGVGHVGLRPEKELIERFIDSLAEPPSPQLVGFNSSSFDLPLLRYRAFAQSVPSQTIHGGNGRDYWYRYGRDHLDLCDVISGFGSSARPSLAELAALAGVPAKVGGIDGSDVERLSSQGQFEELSAYCEADVFVTYLLFLRFSLVTGALGSDAYAASLEMARAFLSDRAAKRPHLQLFNDSIDSMLRADQARVRDPTEEYRSGPTTA